MATRELPSPGELHKYLAYDPDTGVLTWKARTPNMFEDGGYSRERKCASWNAKNTGNPALTAASHGYRHGDINSKKLPAHRAAYALMTGEWPPEQIDHINGVKSDNRWSNLRAVSPAGNGKNMARMSNNTSGFNGVHWHKRAGKWRAEVKANQRRHHLGYFTSKDDAIAARQSANIELGFSERHGTAA